MLARVVSSLRVTQLAARVTRMGQERAAWRAKDHAKTPGLLGGGAGAGRAVATELSGSCLPHGPKAETAAAGQHQPGPSTRGGGGEPCSGVVLVLGAPTLEEDPTRAPGRGRLGVSWSAQRRAQTGAPGWGPERPWEDRAALEVCPVGGWRVDRGRRGGGAAPGRGSRRDGPQVDDQSPEDEHP